MSAPSAAEEQDQTSETPREAARVVPQMVPAEFHTDPQAETQAETQSAQVPIQPEGDIAIDESSSDYSDDL